MKIATNRVPKTIWNNKREMKQKKHTWNIEGQMDGALNLKIFNALCSQAAEGSATGT